MSLMTYRSRHGFRCNRTIIGRSSSIPGLWKLYRGNTKAMGVKNGVQPGSASVTLLRFVPTERAVLTQWCIFRKSRSFRNWTLTRRQPLKNNARTYSKTRKIWKPITGVLKNLVTLKMHAVSKQKLPPSNENASHSTFQTTHQHKPVAWKQTREEMPKTTLFLRM